MEETNQQKPLTAEETYKKFMSKDYLGVRVTDQDRIIHAMDSYAKSLLEQKDREIAELKETNAQLRENFIAVQVQYGEKCAEYTAERQRSARLVEALKDNSEILRDLDERVITSIPDSDLALKRAEWNDELVTESTASAGEGVSND